MAEAATTVAIALARGTTVMASVPSAVASMASGVRVLSEGLLIASVTRAADVALGIFGFHEMV